MGNLLATVLALVLMGAASPVSGAAAGGEGDSTVSGAGGGAPPAQPGPVTAPEKSCLDRSVDALQARYEKVRDLRARFVQTTRPAHLGSIAPDPVTSRGHMVVAKPAKMRWVYEEPDESLVVSDGESLWTYDPAFGEAQRLPVGEGMLSGAAVQFLLGQGDLRRDFEIRAVSCDEQRAELELLPREPASYEKLRVVADPRTGALLSTRIDDLLGNVTLVELSQLETNLDPPASTFRFEAPEGVKVIELDGGGAPRR